jgi:hypothetical protein
MDSTSNLSSKDKDALELLPQFNRLSARKKAAEFFDTIARHAKNKRIWSCNRCLVLNCRTLCGFIARNCRANVGVAREKRQGSRKRGRTRQSDWHGPSLP